MNTRETLMTIEQEANARYLEREELVHALVLALLSRQHLFAIGAPGTAKTELIKFIAGKVEATHFNWLMTRYTTPEELFGAISIPELKEGRYQRITKGKMPEAQIPYLDELFKANSAILNTLLSMLQERVYHNNGDNYRCPLISCIGSSNELPEDDEALTALYDRFLIRVHVEYIKREDNFKAILRKVGYEPTKTKINAGSLIEAQMEVAAIPVKESLIDALWTLRNELKAKSIFMSDRRYVQALDVIKAEAWFNGKTEAEAEDMTIGGNIFWDKPQDIKLVKSLCTQIAQPQLWAAQKILDAAEQAYSQLEAARAQPDFNNRVIQTGSQLKTLLQQVDKMLEDKPTRKMRETREEVAKYQKAILTDLLKLQVKK